MTSRPPFALQQLDYVRVRVRVVVMQVFPRDAVARAPKCHRGTAASTAASR